MKAVWKYPIGFACDRFSLDMPLGAQVLSVQAQHGQPQMWVLVDTKQPLERCWFRCYATGEALAPDCLRYEGTFMLAGGNLVFHLFRDTGD